MYLSFTRAPGEFEGHANDGDLIEAMLEEVTLEEVVAYRDWHYPTSTNRYSRGPDIHQYWCRHFDQETHRCGAYEHRPEVCTDFPYDEACVYCGFVETEDVVAKWVAIRVEQDAERGVAAA